MPSDADAGEHTSIVPPVSIPQTKKGIRVVLIRPPGLGTSQFCARWIRLMVGYESPESVKLIEGDEIYVLSIDDMIQMNVKRETEVGKMIKDITDARGLVSDDIFVRVIRQEITENPRDENGYFLHVVFGNCRFILDGFPETIAQGEKLDAILESKNIHFDYAGGNSCSPTSINCRTPNTR